MKALIDELFVFLYPFLKLSLLLAGNYLKKGLLWLGNRWLGIGVQLDEVVEVIDGHIQRPLQDLVIGKVQRNQLPLHLSLLVLQEVHLRDEGRVFILLYLISNELAFGGFEILFFFIRLDIFPFHVINEMLGYL